MGGNGIVYSAFMERVWTLYVVMGERGEVGVGWGWRW